MNSERFIRFKPGDKVRLYSGGATMTVITDDGIDVEVSWEDEYAGTLYCNFPQTHLVKIHNKRSETYK